jgi:RecB family endonuclease NucS
MDDLEVLEKGLKPLKQESHLRKGMIDILAEDKDGNLVVIELKRRQADYDSVMQLHRYVHEMKKIKNRTTRGILVAPEIRKSAMELLQRHGLEFRSYQFDVSAPRATIAGIEKKQKTIFEALEETNTKKTKTKKE